MPIRADFFWGPRQGLPTLSAYALNVFMCPNGLMRERVALTPP